MNRLVWTTDGENFVIRDQRGLLRYPTAAELSNYASDKEIAEARHRYEASLMPLPSFDPSTGLFYWHDINDQWTAEECAGDIRLLWPGMDAEQLLLSSRLMAALGIKD